MVKRIAPVGVVSFVLLAVCGSVCQNVRQSLPDAPSVQAVTQKQSFNGFAEVARPPLNSGVSGGYAGVMRQGGFATSSKLVFNRKEPATIESNTIFGKYLNPTSQKRQAGYLTSSSSSLMGRSTYAASRIFITRDSSGKARLNTSYLLRTLTAVAKDTASTPYWRRSVGEPFSNFGSTVGNDAGMNLWREFGPGIQQLLKSHTPAFVLRIEDRVTRH
jgi:hypothetical protein